MGQIIELEYAGEPLEAYLAKPEGKPKGAIIVIHEVWGLVDHIKSVADRLAVAGYVALAPELLSELNIKDQAAKLQLDLFNPKTKSETQPRLRELMAPMQQSGFAEKTLGRLRNCFDYLYELPELNKRVAIIGFCFGGSYSFSLAMTEPRLALALPFYGHVTTNVSELKKIKCPVRAFYGANDERLMETLPELQEAMKTADIDFETKVYEDCGHAFFNDTNKFAYNQTAAADAWQRVLAELQKYLT